MREDRILREAVGGKKRRERREHGHLPFIGLSGTWQAGWLLAPYFVCKCEGTRDAAAVPNLRLHPIRRGGRCHSSGGPRCR